MARTTVNKSKPKPVAETTIDIVDGEYELVNMKPIKVSTGIGEFDLENLTKEQANSLIEIGCQWIRKK